MIAAEKDQIYNRRPKLNLTPSPPNYTQILKAAMLKFKAKYPSKSKNQSVKFKPSRPRRKQSRD